MLYIVGNYKHFDEVVSSLKEKLDVDIITTQAQLVEWLNKAKETGEIPFYLCAVSNLSQEDFNLIKEVDPCPITNALLQDLDEFDVETIITGTDILKSFNISHQIAQLDPFAIQKVRLNFNPGGNLDVLSMKLNFACAIDALIKCGAYTNDVEQAVEQILLAQMRAVYTLTGPKMPPIADTSAVEPDSNYDQENEDENPLA